ncbi:glycosyltransferase family 2 protein [Janthinobacterium sp. RB2R34]|uniref:glycosyltransferase family 2 protein n=1 Tax=Janthinobacterium sp. RB2R34 TaxID=3424193 RepID=UPI003F234181
MSNLINDVTSKPILSIGIPIYKRPDLLRRCLDSIITAATDFSVPVYLYDDSLSEINVEVIRAAQQRYPLIFHVVNEKNLGIDENIAKSVELASSKYVWLLGEDDLVAPEAISEVFPILEKSNLPYIYCNYSYISNDYSRIIREKRIEIYNNVLISGIEFFEKYIWAAGFIGGCIIAPEAWLKVDRKKYECTFFTHVGVVAELVADTSVQMIAAALVKNRAEDVSSTSWNAVPFDVMFGWDKMLGLAGRLYGGKSLEKARISQEAVFWHRSLLFLMSKRADRTYDFFTFSKYIKENDFNIFFKFFAVVIAVLPVFIFKLLKNTLGVGVKDIIRRVLFGLRSK